MTESFSPRWYSVFFIALCFHVAGGNSLRASAEFPFFEPVTPRRDCQIVAFGGIAAIAPLNTRRAIQSCIEDSVEWIEVDVRLTRDGKHVLFAEALLDSLSDGKGELARHTLAELQALDAGSWFGKRFARTRILSLDEALPLAKGKINLYLRCHTCDPAVLLRQISAAGMEQQVAVLAGTDELAQLRELSNGTLATAARWVEPKDMKQWIDELPPQIVEFPADKLTAELVEQLHARGLRVKANVAPDSDSPTTWDTLRGLGVDLLATYLPEEAVVWMITSQLQGVRPVRIALHRGASRYAPENTLPAMEKAYRLHADFVEIDVRTSADGACFLLHDGQLNRTTNGTGPLAERTAAEIRQLDAGSWFGNSFAGTPIPTLAEFLETLPAETEIYFDAKAISPEDLLAALEKHDLIARAVVYQSPDYLARLKRICPEVRVMPSAESREGGSSLHEQLAPYAVDTPWHKLSPEYIAHCHAIAARGSIASQASY